VAIESGIRHKSEFTKILGQHLVYGLFVIYDQDFPLVHLF
jgi:hypothetical protein